MTMKFNSEKVVKNLKILGEKIKDRYEIFKAKLKKFTLKLLEKLRKLFSDKVFSKGQMLIFCIIIIYGTFLYQDVIRFFVFIIATLLGWFSGRVGMKQVKAVLEKAERAINSPNVHISKKYTEAVKAVHKSCDYLGRVMDEYNLDQGTAPYLMDLEKYEEELKQLIMTEALAKLKEQGGLKDVPP